jgi:hypothetical protein
MTNSPRIASLHLLESGGVEFTFCPSGMGKAPSDLVLRLSAVQLLWGNPEFQSMLGKAVEADNGSVSFQ